MSHKHLSPEKQVKKIVENYSLGRYPSESEFINDLIPFDKYDIIKGLLDAWDWSRKAGVQMEHAADHSNM